MLAAIIILSLLSLLVATEADPSVPHHEPVGDKPLRPAEPGKATTSAGDGKSGRLAA